MAAARGAAVDRRPVICWPVACPESDAVVDAEGGHQVRLTTVVNPFGQALRKDIAVWDSLAEAPTRGGKILDGLVDMTRAEIGAAFEHGTDGVLYLLYGARGVHTTPMEYGGHYLERDRELLNEASHAAFNMVFVVGEDDAYLDFVSDLPAHAFGWDSRATGVTVGEMRPMRSGALATNSPDADIELRFGSDSVVADLEMRLQTRHAV